MGEVTNVTSHNLSNRNKERFYCFVNNDRLLNVDAYCDDSDMFYESKKNDTENKLFALKNNEDCKFMKGQKSNNCTLLTEYGYHFEIWGKNFGDKLKFNCLPNNKANIGDVIVRKNKIRYDINRTNDVDKKNQ